jgi:hypothetical protein
MPNGFLTTENILDTDTQLLGYPEQVYYSGASGVNVDNTNLIISLTGEVGKVYNGVNPIVVNNEENLISANSAPIGVQEPLYFVQDDDEAVIIGLSGEYVTPSDITGKLDTSSFESWQQGQYTNDLTAINEKINEVSSNIPSIEGLATEQLVEETSATIVSQIPSTAGLASETYVQEQTSAKASKSDLETVSGDIVNLIPDVSNYYTKDETSGAAQLAEAFSNIPLGDEEVNELVHSNSASWNEVSSKLDESTFQQASGLFLTAIPQEYITEGDIPNFISAKLDTSSFADVSGSFLTAVNIPESATWNETTTVVQSNSAQWAEGGSTSGFVSGSNTLFVPHYPGASDGKVYSANISGDITVNYGDYFNSGENINIYATYSLSSVGSQIGDKLNKSVIEGSKTLSIIDDKAEVYSLAYKPSQLVSTGIRVDNYSSPDSVSITTTTQPPYKLYSACLVIESDGFNKNRIPGGWNFVNSANGSATFSRFYKNQSYDNIIFPGFWDYNLTNASAYSVAYSGVVIDALAFKSDLTGAAGDPEVNQVVHTNSATWNTVTDKLDTTAFSDVSGTFLTAHQAISAEEWNDCYDNVNTNSGAWGGSALPISAGPGIKVNLVDNTLVFSNDETVLWSGDVVPNGLTPVAQLSEPISAFDSYEVYCTFESMYPPKVSKFKTPTTWETQPNTNVYFGGIAESVSWKPTENNAIMHAYLSLGFGTNLTDFYCISGANLDLGAAANATATRNNYAAGLYHVYKIIGINRK